MRYLYKIYSQYDGFTPRQIPNRLIEGRFLILGWAKYLDVLRLGDEVWIVFTGRGFEPGVYAQGLVESIDPVRGTIRLRVRAFDVSAPLTDEAESAALKAVVAPRNRQVFLWPADRVLRERCELTRCGNRRCLNCEIWRALPRLDQAHYTQPGVLREFAVVPAYWIIPSRCYLYYNGRKPAPWINHTTNMFGAFKVGEGRYGFPFAAGIHASLRARDLQNFDAIVPIPLSPEKMAAGELDRTATLATELGRLAGIRPRACLSLSGPVSKRRMLAQGFTLTEFKTRYRQLLRVDEQVRRFQRILLLDDVVTKGSTLAVAAASTLTLAAASPLANAAASHVAL